MVLRSLKCALNLAPNYAKGHRPIKKSEVNFSDLAQFSLRERYLNETFGVKNEAFRIKSVSLEA